MYINSAYEFFDIVHEEYQKHIECGERGYVNFFRGQASATWEVTPSIGRKSRSLTGTFEKMIIQEFISRRPNEFLGINNRFNLVAKMQHHGLTTRLLDLTRNPAIALYFACSSCLNDDGEVFVLSTSRHEILLPSEAALIMEFYLDYIIKFNQYNLYNLYNKVTQSYNEDELLNVFYFLVGNCLQIVLTELISERMVRQQSVFAIVPYKSINAGFDEYRKETKKGLWEYFEEKGIEKIAEETKIVSLFKDSKPDIVKYHQEGKRYIIKSNIKKHIIRQLDSIGVNESFVFPELYYEGKNIVDKYLYLTHQSGE